MYVKALTTLTVADTHIYPGHVVELEDWRADRLIALGYAEKITKADALKIQREHEQAAAASAARVDESIRNALDIQAQQAVAERPTETPPAVNDAQPTTPADETAADVQPSDAQS